MFFRIFMRCVSVQSFVYFSIPFVFSVDFQERRRQIPDVGRGEQIVCDKWILGAEELFANRELRVFSSQGTDLQSGRSGGLGRQSDRVLDF